MARLATDQDFDRIATAIRAMPTDQRRQLLGKAARTYHRTWAQLGRIDPSGQTEAGQTAEGQSQRESRTLPEGKRRTRTTSRLQGILAIEQRHDP